MYYYGARYYDPRISIFVSVDPLAEQCAGWTPYHYVHQNPINLIDPTGMSAENGDGGGWLSKAWNSTKNEVKSWFGGSKPNYEVIMEEPQLTTWDYGESVPCIECHHNTTATNGEKIGDLVGGTGAMVISGFGYDNFGGADMPGPTKTIKATDAAGVGMGGADVGRRVLGALQYLNSAFGLWTNDNKEDVISKYMNGLKKDSIYTIQGTERGQGLRVKYRPTNAAANKVKSEFEKEGVQYISITGKEKER